MGKKVILYFFSILMVCVYLGMGGLMVFSKLFDNYSPYLPPGARYVLGVTLMIYGIFRGYRLTRNNSSDKEES